jgi:polyisoprenoid-binding protein YceI
MKKISLMAVAAAGLLLFSFRTIEKSGWTIDKAHAKLSFTVTHMMVSDVEGSFKTFDAKITAVKDDFTDAVVEMNADVNSINTDNEKRDAHLKSPDFFDAAKYPSLTFKSKSFLKQGDGTYKVSGDLTMHGITKTIELMAVCKTAVNPMSKKNVAGFKITGTLKRSDFGLGASMPSTMLSDEIALLANAEFGKE